MLRNATIAFAAAGIIACDVGAVPDAPQGPDGGAPPQIAPDAGDQTPNDPLPPPVDGCSSCHGDDTSPAPPTSLSGETARTAPGVGAHRQHLLAAPDWYKPIECASCHVVPQNVGDPGHIDGDNQAELTFSALNAAATFDFGTTTCSNLYCHGNGRGDNGTMQWTADVTMECTSCHSTDGNLGGRHGTHLGEGISCAGCHQDVVDNGMNIVGATLHIDGQREVSIATGGTYDAATGRCSNLACHGSKSW